MEGDVAMRDAHGVKAERALEQTVRTNKAAIDKQEKEQRPASMKQAVERPQAMAVDKPKNVGRQQLAQLDRPDDRTSFAGVGEGCLLSDGYGLMCQSHTESTEPEYRWDYPKSFAPCDASGSDYDY